jgi:type VI secretion system protein ImpC
MSHEIDPAAIDRAIEDIDRRFAAQIDAILHDARFQRLEAAWRGLRYLVDRIDFRENTRLAVLDCTLDEMRRDLLAHEDPLASRIARLVYPRFEYCGGFPPRPFDVVIATYELSTGEEDALLLQRVAAMSAATLAPFIANASPRCFGVDSFASLPTWTGIDAALASASAPSWQVLRSREESRFVALAMPRILLRASHDGETIERDEDHLWGPASIALGANIARAFARYRWCPNIIGPHAGGEVEGLPSAPRASVETRFSERMEYTLWERGFIALVPRHEDGVPAFFSASSIRADAAAWPPKDHTAQLPYLFVALKVARVARTLWRERIGTWRAPEEVRHGIESWLSSYVVPWDGPPPAVRSRRPFRDASVAIAGDGDRPALEIALTPGFKYMGQDFTLRLRMPLE